MGAALHEVTTASGPADAGSSDALPGSGCHRLVTAGLVRR